MLITKETKLYKTFYTFISRFINGKLNIQDRQITGLKTVKLAASYRLPTGYKCTVVPTKSDSDVIFCLQLLSKILTCTLHLS